MRFDSSNKSQNATIHCPVNYVERVSQWQQSIPVSFYIGWNVLGKSDYLLGHE